jgi:Immunoglobulin domain
MTTTLTLTNVAQSDAASYTVIVTNSAGSLTSWPAILTVLVPPAITAQPQSRTNYFGTTATFSVSATGTEPLSYQWRKRGTNLGDRTDVVLTLTNVGRRDNGIYAVLVTNMLDSVLSSNATLLVRVPQRLGTPCLLSDGTCIILSGDADGGLLSTNDLANFDLYASANLESWLLLTNSLSLTNGQLQLCDPGSTNLRQRFYRIIEH